MRTILFVCTGNTCRSPMAEAIAQRWLDGDPFGDGQRYLAASAGVAAGNGARASGETLRTLATLGLAHDGRSKPLSAEMIRGAHVVLGMTGDHVAAARALVDGEPEQQRKIIRLDPDADVEDPIGLGQDTYDALARRLADLIPKRLTEVLGDEDRAGIGSSRNEGD